MKKIILTITLLTVCFFAFSQEKTVTIANTETLRNLFKGQFLAFTSDTGNKKGLLDVHIYDFTNDRDTKITNTRSRDFHSPRWNTSGDYIAYTSYQGGWRVSLYDIKKGSSRRLTNTSFYEYYPSWDRNNNIYYIKIEPNGSYYNGSREIYRNTLSGKSPQKLTSNDSKGAYFFAPSVSPSGNQMTYAYVDSQTTINIYKQDLTSGKISRLTNSAYNGGPQWSPDGSQIAYYSAEDGFINVYLMNADGSNHRQITRRSNKLIDMKMLAGDLEQILLFNLSWSPDGTHIVYVSAAQNNYDLFVTDVDGYNDFQITTSPGMEGNPSLSPRTK